MPNYGFMCENCEKGFECLLSISKREEPLNEACPHCSIKGKVVKDFQGIRCGLSSDSTLTPDKATGGRWSELMTKMKSGLAPRYHSKLDSATNMTGRRWKG
jgi:putative FmdB family regulatory protein